MEAFLVRLNASEEGAGEIVGIFFAETNQDLYRLVDECCDVGACEAMQLGQGGVYWSDRVNFFVPYPLGEIGVPPSLPGGGTLCENWSSAFFGPDNGGWRSIDWDDE